MKFLCYSIYDGQVNEDNAGPIGYCALGEDGSTIDAVTLDELLHEAKSKDSDAELMEDCGWIFTGEESKLLDPLNAEILKFGILLREEKLNKNKTLRTK